MRSRKSALAVLLLLLTWQCDAAADIDVFGIGDAIVEELYEVVGKGIEKVGEKATEKITSVAEEAFDTAVVLGTLYVVCSYAPMLCPIVKAQPSTGGTQSGPQGISVSIEQQM